MSRKRIVWRSTAVLALAATILISADLPAASVHADNAPAATAAPAKAPAAASTTASNSATFDLNTDLGPFYLDVLNGWTGKGYKPATQTIQIPGTAISAQSSANKAAPGSYEGKSNVLVWKSDKDNWIEYQIDVPQDGLYEMDMSYHPYDDPANNGVNRHPATLAVQFDGSFPFREARSIDFTRKFNDEFPLKRADNGDDVRPRSIELKDWMTAPFIDSDGGYAEPFQWYLTKGKHTLRISGSDPVVIQSLSLKPPTVPADYAQVSAKYPQDKASSNQVQTIQAEQVAWKNDVAIQMVSNQDPLSTPNAKGYDRFNTLGGSRWQNGGQTAAWTFEVPENGRYQIALRTFQGFTSNMATFRTIAIDGQVPFSEMEAYRFPYKASWLGTVLSNDNGKAYDFYLTKGKHTISLTATVGPFQPVIVQGDTATGLLRQVDEEIRAMNGGVVDTNRTWKVDQDFPELPQQMQQVKDQLQKMADLMLAANKKRDNTVQTIETAIQDLTDYLKYPNEIPYHMDDISNMIQTIGGLRDVLVKSPLQLDSIYIAPSGVPFPRMQANIFQKISGLVHNFVYSFIRKDDVYTVNGDTLNVWVNRGRDYINLLQELVDSDFTPQTGIKVKVNLLPNENLLVLSNAAGLSPDVALGQPQDKSTDFAMRNALLDLSKFPDFQQTASQFAPGALIPFYYNGGYYALPETQSFKVMFYRKDILQRLNLQVPDTWNDVYNMLPTLQQNGYNFFMAPGDYLPFFYQNGAQFFTNDGMKTDMSTPEAFKAFKQWTDLFNIYGFEKQVPSFFQHFRTGDFPIGVADYNTYIQLSVAAPELNGWWGIAPMPGVKQADGTVARWGAGGESTGFIYKTSKHPQESWEFLKWLMSADTQAEYGSDLESFNGIAFRWNTANIKAFTQLPWPKEDMKVILEQWRWYKDQPNLPGSYYLGRELNNAWNRTVVDGMNSRESLEQGIVNIDREMVRKEQEFGFVDKQGNVLHTLDLPQVNTPWKGVDPYVAN